MSRYDGLIIPRSYSEYINKTDAATLLQALQQSGVMDAAPTAGSDHPVKSGGIYTAIQPVNTVQDGNLKAITSNAVYNNFINKYRQVKRILAPSGTAIIQGAANNSTFCAYLVTIARDSEQDMAIGLLYWTFGSGFNIKWIIPPTTTRFNVTIVQDSLSKATIKFTINYEMYFSILDLNGRGILTLS